MPSALRCVEPRAEWERCQAVWDALSAPKGRGELGMEVAEDIVSGWTLDLRRLGVEIPRWRVEINGKAVRTREFAASSLMVSSEVFADSQVLMHSAL